MGIYGIPHGLDERGCQVLYRRPFGSNDQETYPGRTLYYTISTVSHSLVEWKLLWFARPTQECQRCERCLDERFFQFIIDDQRGSCRVWEAVSDFGCLPYIGHESERLNALVRSCNLEVEAKTGTKAKEDVGHLDSCVLHRADNISIVAARGEESSREAPKT